MTRNPDFEPGPNEGGTPHEDDETEYVYVKVSRDDAKAFDNSFEESDRDSPIGRMCLACRASLAENATRLIGGEIRLDSVSIVAESPWPLPE